MELLGKTWGFRLNVKGGSGSKVLTNLEAEEYAFNAIKGSDNSDIVVLGRFSIFWRGYVEDKWEVFRYSDG